MEFKGRVFFHRVSSLLPSALLALLVALVALTLLSRLGYPSPIGVSVVISNSMEPALRWGDLIVYASANYSVGDVVVYCLTPSHCIVHRVVDFVVLDTASGDRVLVVAKGDNAEAPDPPVGVEMVRGKVVLTVYRELWLSLFALAIAYALRDIVRTPVIGYPYTTLLTVILVSIAAVYLTVPRPISGEPISPPLVRLAGTYFHPDTCTVSVRFSGSIPVTPTRVEVNSAAASIALYNGREVVVEPDADLLREAFEYGRPLVVRVEALLSNVGRLSGEYTVLVGGMDPQLSTVGGALVVRNPNCFPITVNTSVRWLGDRGWLWVNRTHYIGGLSQIVVEPPEGAELVYAYVYWMNQGDLRWAGLPLKTG